MEVMAFLTLPNPNLAYLHLNEPRLVSELVYLPLQVKLETNALNPPKSFENKIRMIRFN